MRADQRWKPDKRCKVCKAIKQDEELFKRILKSKQYVKGGEALTSIQRDYQDQFSYESLYVHARKHQAPTADDLAVQRLAKLRQDHQVEQFKEVTSNTDIRQGIITRLDGILQEPKKFNAMPVEKQVDLLLKALKHSDDVQAKKKDQDLDILKMMMPHRSGEVEVIDGEYEEFNPWEE